jgi:tRNA pseudouridine55 synthase
MRSLAHDLGKLAGCGAHLESLRRTGVAEFEITDAHTLERVEVAAHNGEVEALFVHPRQLLPGLPAVTATDEIVARIRHGRAVNLPELSKAREVKVFCGQRDLIAISTRVAGTLFHPKVVFS